MKKIITLTILSAFLLTGLAIAQPGPDGQQFHKAQKAFKHQKGMRQGGPAMLLRMADKLELTEQQKAKLETMAVDFKLEQIEHRSQVEKEEVLMKSIMRKENASEGEVFEKIDKISALKAEGKKMQFAHKKAIQGLLTDEQQMKLKELRKNRMLEGRGPGFRGQGDCDNPPCGQQQRQGSERGQNNRHGR